MARENLRSRATKIDGDSGHGNDCLDECAGRAGGFPMMSKLMLAPIEMLTVNIFRCICDIYVSGSGEGWDVALNAADKELGPIKGPEYVARVTSFVRALRAERQGKFSYLGYGCQHICNDELALMTLIKAIRLKDECATKNILQDVVRISNAAVRTCQTAELIANFQASYLTRIAALNSCDAKSAIGIDNQNRAGVWLH